MAYIVTIGTKTKKINNNLGDVVSIQDVKPSAKEYDLFTVIEIGDTEENLHKEFKSSLPEIKKVWNDGVDWKEIKEEPQYDMKYMNNKFTHNYSSTKNNETKIESKAVK